MSQEASKCLKTVLVQDKKIPSAKKQKGTFKIAIVIRNPLFWPAISEKFDLPHRGFLAVLPAVHRPFFAGVQHCRGSSYDQLHTCGSTFFPKTALRKSFCDRIVLCLGIAAGRADLPPVRSL